MNMNIIHDISNFIFVDNNPEKSDIIFIPGGSWPEPSERAAHLWHEQYAPLILPSGKYSHRNGHFPGTQTKKELYGGTFETEWDFMKYVLLKSGVEDKAILKENRAFERGTYDNALMSKEVTDSIGLSVNKAIICCKAFHARRCLMIYSWIYPKTKFLICPSDTENIAKDNWFNTPFGIEKVMAEVQMCGQNLKPAISVYRDTV